MYTHTYIHTHTYIYVSTTLNFLSDPFLELFLGVGTLILSDAVSTTATC